VAYIGLVAIALDDFCRVFFEQVICRASAEAARNDAIGG
jgi:hypothetical protein